MLVFPKNAEKNASTIEKGLGVAQYNISDGDGISQQYLHKLNIGVFAFSPLKIVRSGYICEILKNLLIIINLTRA